MYAEYVVVRKDSHMMQDWRRPGTCVMNLYEPVSTIDDVPPGMRAGRLR